MCMHMHVQCYLQAIVFNNAIDLGMPKIVALLKNVGVCVCLHIHVCVCADALLD
jgi:hypothetical protein